MYHVTRQGYERAWERKKYRYLRLVRHFLYDNILITDNRCKINSSNPIFRSNFENRNDKSVNYKKQRENEEIGKVK